MSKTLHQWALPIWPVRPRPANERGRRSAFPGTTRTGTEPSREEYLGARRKSSEKLDLDRDGKLGFEEYAVKAVTKFAAADKDRNGALNPAEFALTRVVRKSAPKCACRPVTRAPSAAPSPEAPEDPPEE